MSADQNEDTDARSLSAETGVTSRQSDLGTISFTHDWPTCREEACDATAHRIIAVYEQVERPLGPTLVFKRREGLCLLHDAQRE
jgi:hypothetical protein